MTLQESRGHSPAFLLMFHYFLHFLFIFPKHEVHYSMRNGGESTKTPRLRCLCYEANVEELVKTMLTLFTVGNLAQALEIKFH